MSDKNKDFCKSLMETSALVVEESQSIDATDDFDPFCGVVECVEENLDVDLSAPPESQ